MTPTEAFEIWEKDARLRGKLLSCEINLASFVWRDACLWQQEEDAKIAERYHQQARDCQMVAYGDWIAKEIAAVIRNRLEGKK